MRALYIVAGVLLLLYLLGWVAIGVRLRFNEGVLFLWAKLGRIQIKVLPLREKPKDKHLKAKKPKKPKKPKKEKPEKPKRPLPETIEMGLTYGRGLLPVVLEAVGGFGRRLHLDRLRLVMTVGGTDPADAALLYGRASAALGALWYPITQALDVADGTARVDYDPQAQEMRLYGEGELTIRIGQLFALLLCIVWKALCAFLKAHIKWKKTQKERKAA